MHQGPPYSGQALWGGRTPGENQPRRQARLNRHAVRQEATTEEASVTVATASIAAQDQLPPARAVVLITMLIPRPAPPGPDRCGCRLAYSRSPAASRASPRSV